MGSASHPRPLALALHLMTQALEILDAERGPGDVGAHLDLAIQRLKESIAQNCGQNLGDIDRSQCE